jgi:hypothetical protein
VIRNRRLLLDVLVLLACVAVIVVGIAIGWSLRQ